MSNLIQNKKYHFIYKTTNLLNGKFYYGMHSTSNIKDTYLGSGKRLSYSIKKYGRENFKREIIEFLPNRELLVLREKEIVNEELLKESLCMNLKIGGGGGWNIEQQKRGTFKMLEVIWNDNEFRKRNLERLKILHNTTENIEKIMSTKLQKYGSTNGWLGRKQTETHKQNLKNSLKDKQKGELNSQYGTCWINNNIENKKIKKEQLQNYINLGYVVGRINLYKEKYICINKNGLNKCVRESKLDFYIKDNWIIGRYKNKSNAALV